MYAFLQAVFEFHESTKVLRSFYVGQQSLSSIYLTSEYMFATAISSPGDGGVLLKTSWGEFSSRAVVEDSVEHFVTPMDVRVFHRQELQNLGEWQVCTVHLVLLIKSTPFVPFHYTLPYTIT